MLQKIISETTDALDTALEHTAPVLNLRQTGTVTHISSGIARVRGLPDVNSEELLAFPGGLLGMAINLDPEEIGVVLLGDSEGLIAGAEVRRTGRLADTPVGEALLGRMVDATGRALDGGEPLHISERRPVERAATTMGEYFMEQGRDVLIIYDDLTHHARAYRELSLLLRQYIFVSIFRACAESLASEHASRLAAMQAAEKNLEERLDEVTGQYRRLRQDAITSELLDVVAGFEALAGGAD